jgi:hypothetical protein
VTCPNSSMSRVNSSRMCRTLPSGRMMRYSRIESPLVRLDSSILGRSSGWIEASQRC